MKLFGGYIKRKLEDTNLLLAGGGHKSLGDFIGSLQWDDENRKLQYKSASATTWTDLVAFGSNAMSSTSYLPLTGGTITNGSNWAAINFSRTGTSGGSGTVGGIDANGLYFMHQDSAGTSSISMYLKAGEGLKVGGTKVSLDGHTHDYLPLSGGTLTGALTVKQYIFGYNYNHAGGNAPAFVFDKPGSNFTGIGCHSTSDTIWFGAATISNGEAAWVDSYKLKWVFNGTVTADNFYGNLTGNADTATKSTYLYSDQNPYRISDSAPYYAHIGYNINGVGNRWYLRMYPETPKDIAVDYAFAAGDTDTVDGYHASDFLYVGGRNLAPLAYAEERVGNEYLEILPTYDIFEQWGTGWYTVSFDLRTDVAGSGTLYTSPYPSDYTFTPNYQNMSSSTSWEHKVFRINVTKLNSQYGCSGISVYFTYGSGAIVHVKNLKIEKGKVETTFSHGEDYFSVYNHTHPLSQITRGTAAEAYSDWNYIFLNTYGGSLKSALYLAHGGGYGAHLRGYTTSSSVYLLEIYNQSKQVVGIWGDGHINFSDNLSVGTTLTTGGDATINGLIRGWVSSDIWHFGVGVSGGKQVRIGGNTTYGGVIGAYASNDNNSPLNLAIQRDGGTVSIGKDNASYKLDVNGSVGCTSLTNTGPSYLSSIGYGLFILYPKNAYTSNGGTTGAIRISLPTARWKSCTMIKMVVDIYNYDTNTSATYTIGGYNYVDNNWYNVVAYSLRNGTSSYGNLTVRFGNNGARNIIWIGETNTGWSYPKVVVHDVMVGHEAGDYSYWYDGWTVDFTTSFDTVTTYIDNPAINYTASTIGWGSVSNKPEIHSNTVSTYGDVYVSTTKGGYYGINLGPNDAYSTIMVDSGGTHHGLYCTNKGRWILYYNRTDDRTGIHTSSLSSYNITLGGSTYISGSVYFAGSSDTSLVFNQSATSRTNGIIGTYDYTKAAAIWSMGASYLIASNGANLGSLYGAAYIYLGFAGLGNLAGGHQFVWALGGTAYVALGYNVWTLGGFIKSGSSDDYLLSGGGGHKHVTQLVRTNTASSFASLDITRTFIYINGNIGSYSDANRKISVSAAMVVGQVLTVLAYNTGSSTVLTLYDSNYSSLDGSNISCPSGKFLEISILCYDSGKYLISCKSQ